MSRVAVIALTSMLAVMTACAGGKRAEESKKVSSAVELYECDEVVAEGLRSQLPDEVRALIVEPGYAEVVGSAVDSDTAAISRQLEPMVPEGVILKWGVLPMSYSNVFSLHVLSAPDGKPAMGGPVVADAKSSPYKEHKFKTVIETPQIVVTFTPEGAEQFGSLTERNRSKGIAIVVNGRLLSAPRVMERIDGGKMAITGTFTQEETEAIVDEIMASAETL